MSLITFENTSFTAKLDVTRQAKYVQHNTEERWCNHCCRRKSISTAYSEFVFVDLGIQHTIRMCHIAICGLPLLYNIFPRYIITARFSKKLFNINPLNAELNPICHLLALSGAHYIFHVSGFRVKYVFLIFSTPFV
jgi:hypothetical protein